MMGNASHTRTYAMEISIVEIQVMRIFVWNPLNLLVSSILTVFIAKVANASQNTSNAMAFRIVEMEVTKPMNIVKTARSPSL